MDSRTATKFAWPLCAATLVLVACAIGLAILNHVDAGYLSYLVFVVSCAAVGGFVTSHRPTNPVGWLLAGSALSFALMEFTGEYAIYGLVTHPGSLPAARAMAWPQTWLQVPGAVLVLALLPLYFPDGQLVSPRWRWIVRLFIVFSVAWAIFFAFLPGEMHAAGGGSPAVVNPLGIDALQPLAGLQHIPSPFVVMICVAAVSLVVRFRRSTGEERQQLKWITYAAATLPVALVIHKLDDPLGGISALVLAGTPVAIGIAVLRYRLYNIDLIINRTLVYGGLTAAVVGLYVLVVGGLGTLLQAHGNLLISLLAAGLVAVLFAPLHDRLRRGVNRLMYGERDDPYAVISRLGRRLEDTLVPDAVLPTIVQSVREALKLPYVAVEMEGEVRASSGTPVDRALCLPLVYQGSPVGRMLLAPRLGSESFSDADRRLLEDLARQAGIAVHAAALTGDLQRSREWLVIAREEERRRLRRDLHDGLGSRLAALNLQAGALRGLIPRNPDAAGEAVVELRGEIRAAIADIRRLVYDLRPPALDELGLVAAIRQRAARYSAGTPEAGEISAANGTRVQVLVEADSDLPPLPAAIEVAAYRVVEEALTNVVRHAHAQTCTVRLTAADSLCVEVADDGAGLSGASAEGVGLVSMRERAAELGGACLIESMAEGGTRIRARFPLPKE